MFIVPAIVVFILWLLVRKKTGKKWCPWFIPPLLLLLASCSFTASDAGQWISRNVLLTATGWIGGIGGWGASAATVATIALFLILFATVLDLLDKQANKIAIAGLVLVPLLAAIGIGPIADGVNSLRNSVSNVGGNAVESITGD